MDNKEKRHLMWGMSSSGLKIFLHVLPFIVNKRPEYDLNTRTDNNGYKLKRIAFYNGCDDNRSDRYRVYNIAEELKELKITVDIYTAESIRYLVRDPNYDLVIVFREDRYFLFRWYKVKKYLQKNQIPMIYDTDDLIVDKGHTRATRNILKIMEFADEITVSTAFLAKRIAEITGKPIHIIKNTINSHQIYLTRRLAVNENVDKRIKIVYQSGSATHNDDFKIIEKPLLSILKKNHNVELNIFGPLILSDKFKPYSAQIVRHPYTHYLVLQIYISEMQINIAPLEMNDFNQAKSELKIFEAALLRIPTVCSPIASYTSIVQNGVNGYIANTAEEWEKELQELIDCEDVRKRIGNKAYEDFVPAFYIGNEIEKDISYYEKVVCTKKGPYQCLDE